MATHSYRTQSGLYLNDPELIEIANYSAELEKAKASRMLSAVERQFEEKSGALFSIYRTLWGNMAQWGASDKPAGTTSHVNLRDHAEQSIVDKLILSARRTQISHIARQVIVEGKQKGFAVRHVRHSDKTFKLTKQQQATIKEIESVIFAPNREFHPNGFHDVCILLTQGQLILDRKCLVIMRDRRGRPLAWHVLPPDGIKPRYEVLLEHMPANRGTFYNTSGQAKTQNGAVLRRLSPQDYERAAENIFRRFGVDVSEAAYIQELDGIITGAWKSDEMAVGVSSPSDKANSWGYGISMLESSLEVTQMLMYAISYNRSLFLKNYPEAVIALHGNVNTLGLETLKGQIYSEVGPEAGAARLPIISTGNGQWQKMELLKLRDSIRDMEMPQFIRLFTAWKCAAYRAHPSLLNMNTDQGEGRPTLINNADQAFEIDIAQEEGLNSLAETAIADFLTSALLRDYEPWSDYCLVPMLDKILTENEVVELWSKKLQTGGYVIDEMRQGLGDELLAKVADGVQGTFAPNNFFFQAQAAQQQQAEQQIQQLMGQEDQGWQMGDGESKPEPQWTME